MEPKVHYVGEGEPFESVLIEVNYGHPSGAVQAVHPETGQKQLADSPARAVEELWALLRAGQSLPTLWVAVCDCGAYLVDEEEDFVMEWAVDHEDGCEEREEEVHVEVVEP